MSKFNYSNDKTINIKQNATYFKDKLINISKITTYFKSNPTNIKKQINNFNNKFSWKTHKLKSLKIKFNN